MIDAVGLNRRVSKGKEVTVHKATREESKNSQLTV